MNNQLEKILSGLMNVEDDINNLYIILKTLKVYYAEKGNKETNAIIWFTEKQIQSTEKELADCITKLDKYLLEKP